MVAFFSEVPSKSATPLTPGTDPLCQFLTVLQLLSAPPPVQREPRLPVKDQSVFFPELEQVLVAAMVVPLRLFVSTSAQKTQGRLDLGSVLSVTTRALKTGPCTTNDARPHR